MSLDGNLRCAGRRRHGFVALTGAAVVALLATPFSPAPAAPDLASEPILYSHSPAFVGQGTGKPYEYRVFTPARLLPLHKKFAALLGGRVRFHVAPYAKTDPKTKKFFVVAETLTVYYQESTVSYAAIQKRGESMLTTIFTEFRGLTRDSTVDLYARLPDGKNVTAVIPGEGADGRGKNTLNATVNPQSFERGNPTALVYRPDFQAYGPDLVVTSTPLIPETWWTTPRTG